MTARAEERPAVAAQGDARTGRWRHAFSGPVRFLGLQAFSSLTRRIIVLNLVALILLVSGILYLNQFRAGLIDARVASLLTQGEIIAGAIAASATADTNSITIDPDKLLDLAPGEGLSPFDQPYSGLEFTINPERVAPVLRRLVSPTRTRARIYDRDGVLIIDSRYLYSRGQILRFDLPASSDNNDESFFENWWRRLNLWFQRLDLPNYEELGVGNGRRYPEVAEALGGLANSIVRVTDRGELIVSVAVPIQRYRSVYGALLLSTEGGDIDAIVHAERLAIFRVFVVAAGVTVLLSILLAGTIAAPLRRLADAADRVRRGLKSRPKIPDYSHRRDEIGHLSRAVGDMTGALYNRIEAIESFAADVAHELKNPLTSLRSAAETLPLAKNDDSKARLVAIIQHDVRRLDRLISDISNASRLDAELAREDAEPVDLGHVLTTIVRLAGETDPAEGPTIKLDVAKAEPGAYLVFGHDSRLGQIFVNLIDNARSFCRKDGTVRVAARRVNGAVEVVVEDDGPGIRADQFERIFQRFYTDRPDQNDFGQNSGLGLSISKQIVEAHHGVIFAENRTRRAANPGDSPVVCGARFTVRLPAA